MEQGVFEDITLDQPTKEEKGNIIGSKWVLRNKGDEVTVGHALLAYDIMRSKGCR